ncbi:MAG: L-2-amino-thiazoline-4-carboxylic acid hydrolase [Candidatus Thorarchaeota archaeon]
MTSISPDKSLTEDERVEMWKRIYEIRESHTDIDKLKSLLEAFERDYGPDYLETPEEVVAENVRRNAAGWARKHNYSTVEDIVKDMWEGWTEGEFTIERKKDGIQIYCTKCPMADAYKSIGRTEMGLILHCSEDEHIVSGFNPEMKFRRTKTLMDGDDCCDHYYSMK